MCRGVFVLGSTAWLRMRGLSSLGGKGTNRMQRFRIDDLASFGRFVECLLCKLCGCSVLEYTPKSWKPNSLHP